MSIWDVVYNAVSAAFSPVFQQIASTIQTSLAPLATNIISAFQPIFLPISQTLASMWSSVTGLVSFTLPDIQRTLVGLGPAILNMGPTIQQLLGPNISSILFNSTSISSLMQGTLIPGILSLQLGLPRIPTDILNLVNPKLIALGMDLSWIRTNLPINLAGLLNDFKFFADPRFTNINTLLTGPIPSSITDLKTDVAAAKDTIDNRLTDFRSAFDGAMESATKFIASIWADLWKFIQESVIPVVTSAVETVRSGIDFAVRSIGSFLLDGVASIATGAPEDAVARAMGVGVTVSTMLATLYVGVEVVEFLYPTKNLSLIEMVRTVTGAFGVNYFGPTMMGLLIAGTLEPVMRQGVNARYRHQVPSLQLADVMWFQGGLNDEQWSRIYDFAGWSDQYQAAWRKSWYQEPTARTAITMVDIPGPWVAKIPEWLHKGRYDDETISIIQQYGVKKAHLDDQKALITATEADYVAGLDDERDLKANLQALDLDPDEVEFHMAKAKAQARKSLLADQVATTKEKFMDGTIDQGAAAAELLSYGLRQNKVSVLTGRWVAQKTPKLAAITKAKKKNLTLAEIFDLYDRKRWSREKVLARLKDMDYDADDAEDLVWEHDEEVKGRAAAA